MKYAKLQATHGMWQSQIGIRGKAYHAHNPGKVWCAYYKTGVSTADGVKPTDRWFSFFSRPPAPKAPPHF